MLIQKEPFLPNHGSLNLIQKVTNQIASVDSELKNWAINYAHSQGRRLSFDVEYVKQYYQKSAEFL